MIELTEWLTEYSEYLDFKNHSLIATGEHQWQYHKMKYRNCSDA